MKLEHFVVTKYPHDFTYSKVKPQVNQTVLQPATTTQQAVGLPALQGPVQGQLLSEVDENEHPKGLKRSPAMILTGERMGEKAPPGILCVLSRNDTNCNL